MAEFTYCKGRVRIGIQTWGSEGDIRPFVALGHALAQRGHDVEMLYTEISDRRYEAVAAVARVHGARDRLADRQRRPSAHEIGLQIVNTRDRCGRGC